MAVPCKKRIGAEEKKVNSRLQKSVVKPEGGELSMLEIAVIAICIPAAKITSRIVSDKITEKVYGDAHKEPPDEEWRKIQKQGDRSMFLSTLAFYISVSTLILKQLLKIIP